MARSTIQDVAKLAGVSEATVSRALRGLSNVAPATRERVEAAAAELRFTLSKSASSLASGKTHRILLLVSGGLNNWFNSSVLQGAIEILSPEGYDIVPSFVTNRAELSHSSRRCPATVTSMPSSSPRSRSTPHSEPHSPRWTCRWSASTTLTWRD